MANNIINQVKNSKKSKQECSIHLDTAGHCKIYGNDLADEHAQNTTISEAPKQIIGTVQYKTH